MVEDAVHLDGFLPVGEILRSGIYALVSRGEVVYVGQSKCMLTRVYSHRHVWSDKRRGSNRTMPSWVADQIKGIMFDEVWIRPTPVEHLDSVEREMIARYRPRFNIKLKPPLPLADVVIAALKGPRARVDSSIGLVRRI